MNLVGGKNNVGKTAFMEAVYVDVSSDKMTNILSAIMDIDRARNRLKPCGEDTNIIDILIDYTSFSIYGTNQIKYDIDLTGIEKKLHIQLNTKSEYINFKNEINFVSNERITFLDNYGFTNHELKTVFEAVQTKDKEDSLNEYINKFDSNILKFKFIGGDKPQCQTSDYEYRNITEFGDGLKQYISIICSLYKSNNGCLFLDEIENGIHYSNFNKLWEIILTISKEQNVQVFATTHSKECIESYARVAKKLGDEEIKYIKMSRLKDGKIMAGVRDYDMFQYTMNDGHEVRGI